MRFGGLPQWATELAKLIREVVHFSEQVSELGVIAACDDRDACLLPSNLLWREPLFDQLIVNVYHPGEVGYALLKFYVLLVFDILRQNCFSYTFLDLLSFDT